MTPNQITFITALDKTEKQGRAFWPLLLARLEEGGMSRMAAGAVLTSLRNKGVLVREGDYVSRKALDVPDAPVVDAPGGYVIKRVRRPDFADYGCCGCLFNKSTNSADCKGCERWSKWVWYHINDVVEISPHPYYSDDPRYDTLIIRVKEE